MPSRFAALRALVAAMTDGPWKCDYRGDGSGSVRETSDETHEAELLDDGETGATMRGYVRHEDGEGIVALRNRATDLLDVCEAAEAARELLRVTERHCPCGARPESSQTHPHVSGCELDKAIRLMDAALEKFGRQE